MPLLDVPGMTRVAQVFGPTEAGLTVAALEGAGFRVFVPGYHTLTNVQYLSVALGGVPILVDQDQALDAWDFLQALNAQNVSVVDEIVETSAPLEDQKPRGLLTRVLAGLFYLFTGTAPALSGRYLSDKPVGPRPISATHANGHDV